VPGVKVALAAGLQAGEGAKMGRGYREMGPDDPPAPGPTTRPPEPRGSSREQSRNGRPASSAGGSDRLLVTGSEPPRFGSERTGPVNPPLTPGLVPGVDLTGA
jgi:hypothetical protein